MQRSREWQSRSSSLTQHGLHHSAVYVRQSEITPRVPVSEPLVIQSEQVQERGMQVVHVDAVSLGVIAELVRRSVREPAPDAAAREPRREPLRIMVSTAIGTGPQRLGNRRSSELAAP